jgi:hypothetical protein
MAAKKAPKLTPQGRIPPPLRVEGELARAAAMLENLWT